MTDFFISDTEYNCLDAISWYNRPFATKEEMNRYLVQAINVKVGPDDTLFHIGDFSWESSGVQEFRSLINCKNIVLIAGNHDKIIKRSFRHLFNGIYDIYEKNYADLRLKLCHYPFESFDGESSGRVIHLHGHAHMRTSVRTYRVDVCADGNRFSPYSLEDILEIIRIRKNVPPTETKPIETSEDQNV